tara:strand:- start:1354 stop:1947 length:594 start_codon:yes stop_codon:yes gene_type:complete
MDKFVLDTADVDERASIGVRTRIWHLAQVRENAVIGDDCIIGRGAYIGPSVEIGDNVKIQNYALIYDPAKIGDGVFIGPSVILTNDVYPRAIDVDGQVKQSQDWSPLGVEIGEGASVGARTTILAGTKIGPWALIGAGSVVIRDVPSFALVVGNPSRQIGWVGRAGLKLENRGQYLICPSSEEIYKEIDGQLVPINS